jgi:hypothetical protein
MSIRLAALRMVGGRPLPILWTVDHGPVPLVRLGEVVAERLGPGGVAQFGHRFDFDLPDAFSGQPVEVANLIEGARVTVGEPESQPDDAGLPLGERGQHRAQLVL